MRFVHVNAGLFRVSDIAQALSVSAEDDLAILALSAIKVPSQPLGIFVCEVRRVRSVCPVSLLQTKLDSAEPMVLNTRGGCGAVAHI